MKKSLLAFFLFASALAYAETECDVILTNNNFQIPCTIINIGDNEVQYKECPSIVNKMVYVSTSDIRKIYMSDGTIMDYTHGMPPSITKIPRPTSKQDTVKHFLPQMPTPEEKVEVVATNQHEEKGATQEEQAPAVEPVSVGKVNIEPSVEQLDIIITTNAQKIEAKIAEVSKHEIKYKEKDNLDGPLFVIETADIHSILYANGKVVLYNQQSTNNASNDSKASTKVTNVNRSIKYTRKEMDSSCPCANIKIETGEVHIDWKKWLDYINIVKHIDIHNYRTIYIFPIDITSIQLPEQNDNRYYAIAEALESFPYTIRENILSRFDHLSVIVVDADDEVQMREASLGLCLRFDEFELISKDSGVQKITLSGVVIGNTNNHLFDFKQRRLTVKNRPVLVNLQKEFKNFADDIGRILGNLQ